MNVASLALCQELYECSGWKNTSYKWRREMFKGGYALSHSPTGYDNTPAYDLGYLLRKLPEVLLTNDYNDYDPKWRAGTYGWYDGIGWLDYADADTPEDAVAKLAIELFKQGELKKDRDA